MSRSIDDILKSTQKHLDDMLELGKVCNQFERNKSIYRANEVLKTIKNLKDR